MYVQFGNTAAIEGYRDPGANDPERVLYREAPGERITSLSFPDGWTREECFEHTLASIPAHVAPGEKPVWFESDVDGLAEQLSAFYGVSARKKRTKTWGEETGAVAVLAPGAPISTFVLLGAIALLGVTRLDLRTNAGRDLVARVAGDPAANGAGQYAPATYIGLTDESTPPNVGDTVLADEIVVGTLSRAQGAYAHTNGTATYTTSKVFTSDQSITIVKAGVFNASTAGTMAWETLLNSAAILEPGDQLQAVQTVTL